MNLVQIQREGDRHYNLHTVKKMVPLETKCIMVKVNNLMSKYNGRNNYLKIAI